MYDTLDLTLSQTAVSGIDFLETIPQYLTDFVSEGNTKYGKYVSGYLDSLKVSINQNRVKIYDSSLCKYWFGNNFQTLSRGETQRAIEKISDSLHLPFDQANVTRIDFAQNFIMKYDGKIYYPYLGEAQYYSRLEQNNGLYYNNQKRQLLFYGKVKEQREKRQPIPELYKHRNTLRYEFRFRNRLREQLNRPEITAGLLYDGDFYRELVKRWKNEYLSIQKINSKLISMKPTGSKKEFAENLALYSILELGQPQLFSKVKEWRETGEISKKQEYDLKAFIKDLAKKPIDEGGNELIEELNQKIKQAARNY